MAKAKEQTAATSHVRNAKPAEEKVLTQKVAPLFDADSDVQKAGIRFGRKLLRVKNGTRTSAPPKGILSDQDVASIYKALGIAKPERKAAAPKAEKAAKTEQPVEEAVTE